MKRIALVLLFLNGCAFKESPSPVDQPALQPVAEPKTIPSQTPSPISTPLITPEPTSSPIALPSASPTPSPIPSQKPKLKLLELKRISPDGSILASRSLSSKDDIYVITQPIGLDDSKKEDLEFEIVAQNLEEYKSIASQVVIRSTNDTPATFTPKLQEMKSDGALRFRILSTYEALDQIRTNEVEMKLGFSQGETKIEVKLNLLRRPRKIETTELDYSQFAQHPNRFIDLANLKLSLIRALQIKSSEKHNVLVYFDVRNAGSITTSTENITVNALPCSYSSNPSTTNIRFDEGLVILPILEGITKDSLWNILSNDRFTSEITPNSTLLVGLYAVGEKARILVRDGYPKQSFQPVSVVTGCRARCGEWPNNGIFFRPDDINKFKPTVIWTSRGRPGASQDCIDIANRALYPNADPRQQWHEAQPDEQKIVRCALWELSNGSAPWDLDIRFCGSAAPGNIFGHPAKEYWAFQKSTATVLGGMKTNPVTVKLDTSNLKGVIRHLYPAEDKIIPQSPIATPFASEFNLFN